MVNTGFIDRVKDLGFASVFYLVYKSCIDHLGGQYSIYRGIVDLPNHQTTLPRCHFVNSVNLTNFVTHHGIRPSRAVLLLLAWRPGFLGRASVHRTAFARIGELRLWQNPCPELTNKDRIQYCPHRTSCRIRYKTSA